MTKEQIEHTINNHYRKLNKHIKDMALDFDAEKLHEFRVEYKKLRAFLRMISFRADNREGIGPAKKLKTAYRIAGLMRSLQLQKKFIPEATKQAPRKPQQYLKLIQKEIKKFIPEFSDLIHEKPVTQSRKKTNESLPGEFQILDFKLFVQKKQQALASILTSAYFSDDDIHRVRKILKDLSYNFETFNKENVLLPNDFRKEKDEKFLNTLLDELGSFQDKRSAIALLKIHWLNSLDQYNRELLEHIKKLWIRDRTKMKQLLVKKLKRDIGFGKPAKNIISAE